MNRKILIISTFVILIIGLILFFVLRNGKSTGSINNNSNLEVTSANTVSGGISNIISDSNPASSTSATTSPDSLTNQTSDGNSTSTISGEQATVDVVAVNKKFVIYAPKTKDEQLVSYSVIAAKGNMEECDNLAGETDQCKHYFSVYKNKPGLCGDIDNSSLKLQCYKELIFNGLEERVAICSKEADNKANCLAAIFWGAKTTDDCEMFSVGTIRQFCVDSVIIQSSITTNKSNCSDIRDSAVKASCDQFFSSGDFDKDGLSDAEEIKIGTNPYATDTDGDGYSDKEEIDKGYNPCGDGLLPSPVELFKMCAKFKK